MSKVLIIESIGRPIERDLSKTSVAHVRNAVAISDILGADLITCERDMGVTEGVEYDHIICSYASPYMKYKTLISVVEKNPQARLWWLVNDHDLEDNILLRNVIKNSEGKRKISMVCNNPREGYRPWILRKKMKSHDGEFMGYLNDFIEEWHTVNLNCLIYKDHHNDFSYSQREFGAVYWGTFRKWRLDDFLAYQGENLTMSVTPRIQKKFVAAGVVNSPFVDKLSWQDGKVDANKFKYSLYIEDQHTHDNYAFMANRYYEALSYGLITFFDLKCIKNVEKSEFEIPEYCFVESYEELNSKIHQFSESRYDRFIDFDSINRDIAAGERVTLISQLKEIFS